MVRAGRTILGEPVANCFSVGVEGSRRYTRARDVGHPPYMRRLLLITALLVLLNVSRGQQAQTLRVSLVPRSNVGSGEVTENFQKECSGVVLTLDSTKADYLLEADARERPNGRQVRGVELTLFSQSGDVLFHTKTANVHNAFKDVCKYLNVPRR